MHELPSQSNGSDTGHVLSTVPILIFKTSIEYSQEPRRTVAIALSKKNWCFTDCAATSRLGETNLSYNFKIKNEIFKELS